MSLKDRSNGGQQTKSGSEAPVGDTQAEVVARLAYEKWQARGCPEGDDRRDWFEAEQEITAARVPQANAAEGSPSGKRA
jgi:hypothetical protein